MPLLRGPESRLLAGMLRPERRAVAGVSGVLLVAITLRLAMPALLGRFVDGAIGGRPLSHLTTTAALYVAVAVGAEALGLVGIWRSVHLSWRTGNRLRERLARHAVRLDMAWHGNHSPGQLIERIDGDVESLVVFFTNVLVHVIGNVVLMIAMLVVAFVIDPLAGVLLTISGAAGATVLVRLRAAAVPAREAEREANAVLYGDLEERLGGLEDLRANGAGNYAVHRLHANSARSWWTSRRASLLGDGSYAMAAVTFAAGSVGTLAAGFVLHERGLVTVGQVVALFRYSEMLRQPLERIAEQMKEFQKALAGARRAARLLDTPGSLPEGSLGDEVLPEGALSVDFDRVTFSYNKGAQPALRDIDLHLPAGTHLGVIGRTGTGKTTLGRLALRLWDTTEGAVRIGGIDVRDLKLETLRSRVGVVTQDVELFRASLRDNLTLFGTYAANDDRLESVLSQVGLATWYRALPDGLETDMHGAQDVSGGEAQLLAFARAFLAAPDVVILDEASSRLDPVTEDLITNATRTLLAGRTAIVVAHRLATLDAVDLIAVLEHGRLAELGAREDLAADPASRYARLLRVSAGTTVMDG